MGRGLRALVAGIALTGLVLQPVVAQAQASIGNAQKVVRNVQGTLSNNVREIVVEDDVFSDERIDTGSDSAARLIFKDQTMLSVGADSNVVLDRFVYNPDPSQSTVSLSISRGVLRFVTGNLPKSNYQIRTPTALIGVRGTIFEVIVAANGTTTVNVIEGVVSVTAGGSTSVASAGQTISVAPGAPPTPPTASPPAPPAVVAMNEALGPAPGQVGSLTGEGGAGGLSAGALAAGIAAAVGLGILVSAVTDDDDDEAATSTSTSTATATVE